MNLSNSLLFLPKNIWKTKVFVFCFYPHQKQINSLKACVLHFYRFYQKKVLKNYSSRDIQVFPLPLFFPLSAIAEIIGEANRRSISKFMNSSCVLIGIWKYKLFNILKETLIIKLCQFDKKLCLKGTTETSPRSSFSFLRNYFVNEIYWKRIVKNPQKLNFTFFLNPVSFYRYYKKI